MGDVLTGVGAVICASHYDDQGRLHGHTYDVVAWFKDADVDALVFQRDLERLCSEFCHTILPAHLARAEDLAQHLKVRLLAHEVEVRRPLERLYARAL